MKENYEYKLLSILRQEEIEISNGLPRKAIYGFFKDDKTDPESFIPNPEFIDCLHNTIKNHSNDLKSLQDEASKQVNGYIYIIDLRTEHGIMGDVPTEDIIGAFRVCEGKIITDEYSPNPNYQIYSKDGLIKLPQELKDILIKEIKK